MVRVAFCHLKHTLIFTGIIIWKNVMIVHKKYKEIISLNRFKLLKTFQSEKVQIENGFDKPSNCHILDQFLANTTVIKLMVDP